MAYQKRGRNPSVAISAAPTPVLLWRWDLVPRQRVSTERTIVIDGSARWASGGFREWAHKQSITLIRSNCKVPALKGREESQMAKGKQAPHGIDSSAGGAA